MSELDTHSLRFYLNFPENYGSYIRALRKDLKLRQRDIAKIFGVCTMTAHRIEAGKTCPTKENLARLLAWMEQCEADEMVKDLHEKSIFFTGKEIDNV